MLRQRTITAIVLVIIVPGTIVVGFWLYALFILAIMTVAGLEYTQMARALNMTPARSILLVGVWGVMLAVAYPERQLLAPVLTFIIILALVYHLIQHERGSDNATRQWTGTTIGVVYLGLMGGYMLAIRRLPNGQWWTLIILPAIMVSDTGAYVVGRVFGRHKMVARLSPKKTWEGLFGGLVISMLITSGLAWLWQNFGQDADLITWQHGLIISLFVSFIGLIGDLGISMIKREASIKDTGSLLPGMGGVLDRIDSWLLASVAGYYYVTWVVLV